jgi:hypothetical protein
MTGAFRAVHPMLVRVAEGPEPFYRHAPQAVRASKPDPEIVAN